MQSTRSSTLFPNDDEQGTIFVRIPEPLDTEQRIRKYDEPLLIELAKAGSAASIRGFSAPDVVGGVALDITPAGHGEFMIVMQFLVNRHAPSATEIEMDFATSAFSTTLSEIKP